MTKISTYTSGFTFKVMADFTKGDYVNLCDMISVKLNSHNGNGEIIKMTPEWISEGGMRMTEGNNNDYGNYGSNGESKYKTMRHACRTKDYRMVDWPRINKNTYNDWKTSNEVLWKKDIISSTFLKAFYEAPAWTLDEIKIIMECFELFGMKCNKMPKKKDLVK